MRDDVNELAELIVLGQIDIPPSQRSACAIALSCLRTFRQISSDADTSLDDLTPELVVQQFTGKKLPNDVMKRMAQEIESHGTNSPTESLLELRRIAARLVLPPD